MKHLLKIAVLFAAIGFFSIEAIGQKTLQSKLNVGANAQKVVDLDNSTYFFADFPNKLNLTTKTEYSQFYRNLLLKPVVPQAVAEKNEQIANVTLERQTEKVKFGKVFPNPADAYATVQLEIASEFKYAKIVVMSMVGEIEQEYAINKDAKDIRLNTSRLSSGIYMVQGIVDGKKMMTQKLLVDHN